MASANQYPGIDARIVARVRYYARRLHGTIPGMTLEDLEQELMLQIHRRLRAYDPARAQLTTFLDRILRNVGSHLLEAARARRRGPGAPVLSLDQLWSPAGCCADQLERAAPDDAPLRPAPDLDWCDQAHLRHDLERALGALPQHLVACCRWLTDGSITEAARRSGLARGSIHSRVTTLRRRLTAAGLDAYVAAPARQF